MDLKVFFSGDPSFWDEETILFSTFVILFVFFKLWFLLSFKSGIISSSYVLLLIVHVDNSDTLTEVNLLAKFGSGFVLVPLSSVSFSVCVIALRSSLGGWRSSCKSS